MERVRQRAPTHVLAMSLSSWETVMSLKELEGSMLMVCPLYHGRGCVAASGSTSVHAGIGLA